jgi:mitochondrial GTPase 1
MRSLFEFHGTVNWFPGHMLKSLKALRNRLTDTNCIIEIRDARLPWSSINDTLEKYVLRNKKRIIIYNKVDLANPNQTVFVERQIEKYQGERPMFVNAREINSLNGILNRLIQMARGYLLNPRKEQMDFLTDGFKVIIVGIPNVGKSTIINALRYMGSRKPSAAGTSPLPGYTRSLSSWITLAENPKIYLMDSPGIMVPKVRSSMIGLNLALSGAVKETIVDKQLLADYLLYQMNRRRNHSYLQIYELKDFNDSIHEVLPLIARRIGAFSKGGVYDLDRAAEHFLTSFRTGKLGRITLDPMENEFVENYFNELARER